VLAPAAVGAAIPKWLKDVEQFVGREAVAIGEERNTGPRFPPAINYYAVGMGVMYLLFGVSMAGQSILIERREGTLPRLRTTPTTTTDIVTGKLLATFLTGFVQFGLLVVFTRVLYGVEWGAPSLLAVMVTATSLAAAGLGTLVAAFSRSAEAAESLAPAIILPMSFLGGSMWPIYAMPAWMDTASRLTFNRWALDGFLTVMSGAADLAAIARPVVVLLAMALIFAAVGTRRLRFQ
jgi:ABC-2 type transport system permease protein